MGYYPEQLQAFKNGSKTYYNATRYFPDRERDDVIRFYGFVRTADDLVDSNPQKVSEFDQFCRDFEASRRGIKSGNILIDDFVLLEQERGFDPAWSDAFLHSMRLDISKKRYETFEETLEYIYGSAEVIGIYMSAILGLAPEARYAACMQGRSMQIINFIRDIAEDLTLGRTYLPMSETSLPSLDEETVRENPEEFVSFMRKQIDRYFYWQNQAEQGYSFLPRRIRIPIKTASDMYRWTGLEIQRDPFVVYRRKVKPAKLRILLAIFSNWLTQH